MHSDVTGRSVTEMFLGDAFSMARSALHRVARVPSSYSFVCLFLGFFCFVFVRCIYYIYAL